MAFVPSIVRPEESDPVVGTDHRRGCFRARPQRGHASPRELPRGIRRHQARVHRPEAPLDRRQLPADRCRR